MISVFRRTVPFSSQLRASLNYMGLKLKQSDDHPVDFRIAFPEEIASDDLKASCAKHICWKALYFITHWLFIDLSSFFIPRFNVLIKYHMYIRIYVYIIIVSRLFYCSFLGISFYWLSPDLHDLWMFFFWAFWRTQCMHTVQTFKGHFEKLLV